MRKSAAVIILFMLGLANAGAQTTNIIFTFSIDNYPESRIIKSLYEGHRSEVLYEFRLLQEAEGIRKIFGDRLIEEEKTVYVARWDPLNESFVVLIDGSAERIFNDPQSFLDFFLSIKNRAIPVSPPLAEDAYLLCRWSIQPIKLVPPLTLMTLIKPDLQTISSWERTAIEEVIR